MKPRWINHVDFPGVTLIEVPEIDKSCTFCVFKGYPGTDYCPRETHSRSAFSCMARNIVWIKDTPEDKAAYVAERMSE